MYEVKQSTALALPLFVHDVNGDGVTGLTNGSFTKRISKNGAAFGAMTVTITELENGWYSIPLSASHSDTLGLLSITFTNAGAKQVNVQFRVVVRLNDDLAFPTTIGRSIDVTAGGTVGIDWGNVENPSTAVDLSGTDIQLADTVTTNSDMRGTDNAALASVLGALADAASSGDPTASDTVVQYLKQVVNTLEGSAGIPVFPAEAAPANAVSIAEILRAIHADVTGLAGSTMRGTDSALLASSAPTNFSDLSISVTTGLVDITQTAADKIWSTATRTLTAISATISQAIADEFLNRDMGTGTDSGSPTVRTVRDALRFLRNKWSIAAGTLTVTKEDDATTAWTAVLTTDAAADPVTGNNPAGGS